MGQLFWCCLVALSLAIPARADESSRAASMPARLVFATGPIAGQPSVALEPGRGFIVSWQETHGAEASLHFAAVDFSGRETARGVIARGRDWFVNWADVPGLAVLDNGDWVAFWLRRSVVDAPEAYDIRLVRSRDRGRSWSAPVSPHRDGTPTQHGFVSLLPEGRDRVRVFWLDGRLAAATVAGEAQGGGHDVHGAHDEEAAPMTLRTAVLDRRGEPHDEALLDARTCSCCQTDAARTDTGTTIVYRDRSDDEIRDIAFTTRGRDGRWSAPALVHVDGWHIEGCPVNGPALAANGARLLVVWPTLVGQGFELSEVSNSPVMLMVRIRSCHVTGSFECRNNVPPPLSVRDALSAPRRDFSRVVLPPMSYAHEQDKVKNRWPAAEKYIRENGLNERFGPADGKVGIVLQGGMYNGVIRALQRLGLANIYGDTDVPLYVMNVTYPIVTDEFLEFCKEKEAVLVVEEGQPEFIEQGLSTILLRSGAPTKLYGKNVFPMAGEYTGQVMLESVTAFLKAAAPQLLPGQVRAPNAEGPKIPDLSKTVPIRPPSFCTGCPERPIFAALKLVEKELGKHQITADIGCHLFATLPPFEIGGSTMGYGLGPASNSAFDGGGERRPLSIIGDGGFWHNGLSTSIGNMVFNRSDGVAVVVDNYYSAATGGQDVLSSRADNASKATKNPIAKAVQGIGVKWVRQVDRTYDVGRMRDVFREALTTTEKGPKVIVASSECMLNRQRREKPLQQKAIREGRRVEAPRFGVDEDVCTGDHACIRLSGCPSLGLKRLDDPLRDDPVASIDQSCVGCGNCGEVADAAVLCPSFYRADVVHNPGGFELWRARISKRFIGWLMKRRSKGRLTIAGAST